MKYLRWLAGLLLFLIVLICLVVWGGHRSSPYFALKSKADLTAIIFVWKNKIKDKDMYGLDVAKIATDINAHLSASYIDPWGMPYVFVEKGGRIYVGTYGADGVQGGDGEDEDFFLEL